MSIELTTFAEKRAQEVEHFTTFGGLNLLHIKRQVASMLSLIGRDAIFDQYTKHDISHIDGMLRILDWVVPDTSKKAMSECDWLMIVLAIYFHDMGMLVTKAEFEARSTSGYLDFCEHVLFAGPNGPDYRAKVDQLPVDRRDRFLYQEFVRHKHAERIRAWIMGQTKDQFGLAHAAVEQVSKLLEPLGPQFRRDLGIVCESHHLNDLGDTTKYKISQPYGNSDAETVNLQYCAVLLRTSDLLHITSDRTPSIEFRTINPSDPVSQQEWAKQMAVRSVRPRRGVNDEGQVDDNAIRDTIEVHAYFNKEDGFFGLTSYLVYAADQLKKSHEWISTTNKLHLATTEFPWRKIDDSNIETEGFIRDAFEFTIDQARILDLLTGHTLYNDTRVVLRELIQNSIDAIRLKFFPSSPAELGHVAIHWDSGSRILSVQDNGTGMTQEIINKFLLKVGSSRYQDPEFIKNNPNFSSISRFGIGVLSAFMIADSVEIISCHPDEEQARRLTLRSVHGKYLIRLLDKGSEDPQRVGAHGTIFRIHVRPSVEILDVEMTARHWIVVPDCKVTVQIDDHEIQRIGFASPKEALRDLLRSSNLSYFEDPGDDPDPTKRRVRIVERQSSGVTLAYALVWDRWFKEWSFLMPREFSLGNRRLPRVDTKDQFRLGTCVEGIRIVSDTPGFEGYPIVALVNVRGQSAPKTNVARSGLEITPERDDMLREIYSLYAQHIMVELAELTAKRSFSPTWAAGEAAYLLVPLLTRHGGASALSPQLLEEAISAIPCVMVEERGRRFARSPRELSATNEFWTINCGLLSSAEALIRETASAASLSEIVNALDVTEFHFPDAPVVCAGDRLSETLKKVFDRKEVDRIVVNPEQRRLDLRWVDKAPMRWIGLSKDYLELVNTFRRHRGDDDDDEFDSFAWIPGDGVTADVPSGEVAVRAFNFRYLVPGSPVATFARQCIAKANDNPPGEHLFVAVSVLGLISEYLDAEAGPRDIESLRKALREGEEIGYLLQVDSRVENYFDFAAFAAIMIETNWKTFDVSAWTRGAGDMFMQYG